MSAIYEIVKDMGRGDKMAYFKTITAEEKKSYDNYMNYQRVLKQRNKNRTKYNEYMKVIKNKSRAANPQLYRLQNNKDVANYRARKTLTPNEASQVISNNIKKYIERLRAIKQGSQDVVHKKFAANAMSHKLVDDVFNKAFKSVDFNDMTVRQLKKIVIFNKKADGSSLIFDYVKKNKAELIKELNKLKNNIKIPSDI